jgi:K+-sensing histidine kinase KdpD
MLRMSGTAAALALEMLRADGTRVPVLVTSRLKHDAAGAPSWVRTTVFDATAHRRYEEELRAARDAAEAAAEEARRARAAADTANEAKSRFLAAMNHEFRSPINIISGFAEVLATPGLAASEADRKEYLAEMRGAALHLVGLLEDASRYGRLDAMERAPRLRPARLRAVAEDGLRIAGAALGERGVEASLVAGPDDPSALVNEAVPEALACVLRDVAQRAPRSATLMAGVRALRGGGAIALWGSALAQSEAALRALLSPLDAPEVRNRGLEGSGLGIAYAQRVLRICGGAIDPAGNAELGFGLVLRFSGASAA